MYQMKCILFLKFSLHKIDSKDNIKKYFFEMLNYNTHHNTFKNAIYYENDIQFKAIQLKINY